MVIITCCNFAFGPMLTRYTLLPGWDLARLAASNNAWAAHGSSTAGSIISFFSEGMVPAIGSRVWSGSGTMLAQTMICNGVLIFSSFVLSADLLHRRGRRRFRARHR